MENIINILLYSCKKTNIKIILKLSNISKEFHNILNNIAINIVKSYYNENIQYKLDKIQFNLLFKYYLSWCDIKDITFLEQLQKQKIEKNISKYISYKLNLNTGRFMEYKRLQLPLYYYHFIYVLYNNYYTNNNTNMILLIRLGCSTKLINNHIMTLFYDYYINFKKTLIINIQYSIHLLILKHFLIFCDPHYAKSIYELKSNKFIDYDTKRLLDKYLHKKKFINQLRCKHGIIL